MGARCFESTRESPYRRAQKPQPHAAGAQPRRSPPSMSGVAPSHGAVLAARSVPPSTARHTRCAAPRVRRGEPRGECALAATAAAASAAPTPSAVAMGRAPAARRRRRRQSRRPPPRRRRRPDEELAQHAHRGWPTRALSFTTSTSKMSGVRRTGPVNAAVARYGGIELATAPRASACKPMPATTCRAPMAPMGRAALGARRVDAAVCRAAGNGFAPRRHVTGRDLRQGAALLDVPRRLRPRDRARGAAASVSASRSPRGTRMEWSASPGAQVRGNSSRARANGSPTAPACAPTGWRQPELICLCRQSLSDRRRTAPRSVVAAPR